MLLLLTACALSPTFNAPEPARVTPVDTAVTPPDPTSDSTPDSAPESVPDSPPDDPAPTVLGVSPTVADPAGGGGRVVITVNDSAGITAARLGDRPLTDLRLDDNTHVSGVPGPHDPGVVDVVVSGSFGDSLGGEAAFSYWDPREVVGLDLYLDARYGVSLDPTDPTRVIAWQDQGPAARRLAQDPARAPTLEPEIFDDLPGLRFDGAQDLVLDGPVSLAETSSSTFAVVRWTASTDTFPPPGNAGNLPLTLLGDGTNGYGAFGAAAGQVCSNHYVGGPVYACEGADLNDGAARLIGAVVDPTLLTHSFARLYVGNTQQGVDTVSSPLVGLHTYDRVGAGYPGMDGWNGSIGALVVVAGTISSDDLERLDQWATQRWGTPASPPMDRYQRTVIGSFPTSPDDWYPRDGSQIVALSSGRLLSIGGWSPYDPWGGDRTTNEVWASDDQGVTWFLLLPHDPSPPSSGPGARFPRGHTVGVSTLGGHAVVVGTDGLSPPYLGEVWVESDDGATWTRVSETAPSLGRSLHMLGTLGDDLYLMGGQTSLNDESTSIADVWRSSDGGVSWTELDPPPWAGRGMVYRPVEHHGQLFVVAGGRYDDTDLVVFNGVYSFDGTDWTTVLADGHTQWEAATYVALASSGDRLWLINGYTTDEDLARVLVSDDDGVTWSTLPGGAGGYPSHADAVLGRPGEVLRVSGNLSERAVWRFEAR